MINPYQQMPPSAFWRTAVADLDPTGIRDLWNPKHPLTARDKVATAGSCFAQHIGRALSKRGFQWFDGEPAPPSMDRGAHNSHGYGLFSFRTGNIYTAAALRQWVHWAFEVEPMPGETWQTDGRFFDPFRPNIQPGGFESLEALRASQQTTLAAIRQVIREADLFVFTLGLTEGWVNEQNSYVYAMCPGTLAGEFDGTQHRFKNFRFNEIIRDLRRTFKIMRMENPHIRFLLTVSPVPLTATASGEHVLTATVYSKSVLRAVAGQLAAAQAGVDYFPSYEIITAPPFHGQFYEANMRSVAQEGVDFVMDSFFECLKKGPSAGAGETRKPKSARRGSRKRSDLRQQEEVICEDAMLETFGSLSTQQPTPKRIGVSRVCVVGNSHITGIAHPL